MTDALARLIADLREKEAKATPGPWFPVIAFVEGEDYSTLFVDGGKPARTEDFYLVGAIRDRIKPLLDVAEALGNWLRCPRPQRRRLRHRAAGADRGDGHRGL